MRMTVETIPLNNLVENDYNPRKTFNDAKMDHLMDSIDDLGLLEPLVTRRLDGNGTQEVIGGVRRLRAMQEIDYDEPVPVNVLDVNREQAKLIALSENMEREDLSPVEEARAFAEYVRVTVPKEEAKELSDLDFDSYEDANNRTRYTINFSEYVEHIKGGQVSPRVGGSSIRRLLRYPDTTGLRRVIGL